jgi:hypothetical protein
VEYMTTGGSGRSEGRSATVNGGQA